MGNFEGKRTSVGGTVAGVPRIRGGDGVHGARVVQGPRGIIFGVALDVDHGGVDDAAVVRESDGAGGKVKVAVWQLAGGFAGTMHWL